MKSGFSAIIGRPSAGKSTLLNALCGEKVAITSPVPQTTRNAIRGIINRSTGQIVFLDTPGYHESDKKLNLYLKDVVHRALDDADVVLYVVDGSRTPGREEASVMKLLKDSGKPVVAVVNKIDLDTPRLDEIRGLIRLHLNPTALLDVSASEGRNLEAMVEALMEQCTEGELHYPTDFYTDQEPEFRISEIIREQAIARSEQEVPHALYVEIADTEFKGGERWDSGDLPQRPAPQAAPIEEESETESVNDEESGDSESGGLPAGAPEGFFDEESGDLPAGAPAGAPAGFVEEKVEAPAPRRKSLWIRAFLVVERESQVGILVGKKGARIKSIRIDSIREMNKIFPWKISLDLRVKVNPKWRKKDPLLKKMLGSGE